MTLILPTTTLQTTRSIRSQWAHQNYIATFLVESHLGWNKKHIKVWFKYQDIISWLLQSFHRCQQDIPAFFSRCLLQDRTSSQGCFGTPRTCSIHWRQPLARRHCKYYHLCTWHIQDPRGTYWVLPSCLWSLCWNLLQVVSFWFSSPFISSI